MRTLLITGVVTLLSTSAACAQDKWVPVYPQTNETEVNLTSIRRDGASIYAVVRSRPGPGAMTYEWILVDCKGVRIRVTKSATLDTETGKWLPAADSALDRSWIGYPDGSLGHGIVTSVCANDRTPS